MTMASADPMQYEDLDNFTYYVENFEEDEPPLSYLSNTQIVSLVLHGVAFLLGVPGNAIVIWIMGFKWNKSVTSLWFLNLAIADLIFVLFLPFYITYVAMGFHWPFGKWLCKANSFIALFNMFASVFFLTAISLDRYVHLIHPVFSYKYRSLKNTLLLTGVIWFLATAIGSPALYFRDTLTLPNNFTICYNNFHTNNLDLIILRHNVLIWVRFICGYLFPLLTMIVCYSLLIIQVKKSAVLTSSRLFWTVIVVVAAFFVCWTPYQVFSILELSAHRNAYLLDLFRDAIPLTVGFAFINSCLNPILYVLLSKKCQFCCSVTFSELVKHTLLEVSQSGTVSEQVWNSMRLQQETLGLESSVGKTSL
ncbi:chemerin-like receptor 2 [Hemicordylus capensis]|uniref:chemerin-like receptor 2 n=1 Tax=Hemicordylus capensis TaxID=884348 RepID=UPI002304A001|nr:chemerin-like receptor 2 [Hemicordylus capensis]XP_053142545.1 chemerin-like receptor 2 [Hemicordylus capensis]XP_053142546.1 chemerin-like receptor 2 [Hemicordylus capensis]XP_053142547.1 chemerin-like receptor 2 [Hemicordylus capensis]XP_053142548.1 chemerin-like receptor 2 [Hemicordylus capensis]XP_053142549.1 chemerin-like receptor 2 [Hemicordylus capensis]XP_053142550.1 chemerin-like receptor 2 [Hemicordylus capensis]XP_053142551.1 chemerin-like receptor 2 [Hemicordylus capensis]XP_